MKVTMKKNYLEIEAKDDLPKLCIDTEVAGILLWELFSNGVESMEEQYNILMELLKEEEDE